MNSDNYEDKDIIIRKARIDDNFEDVAELIYDTDESIYHYWFHEDVEEAKRVLAPLIKEEGFFYNYQSMYVAIDRKMDRIVGLMCVIEPGTNLKYNYDKLREVCESYSFIVDNYVLKIIDECLDLGFPYISNVCVNKDYRGRRIGDLMFSKVFNELKNFYQKFLLDILADNPSALRIYQKHGFEVIDFYMDIGWGKFDAIPTNTMLYDAGKRR